METEGTQYQSPDSRRGSASSRLRKAAIAGIPSVMKAPWMRCIFEVPAGRKSMSPWPSRRLGAALVEDHPRVDLRGDGERDPGRDVDLDRPGDDVGRRALGGEQQVDADRPGLLGQADDRVLDLGRGDHHQVGELVDHAEDVRQRRALPRARGPG